MIVLHHLNNSRSQRILWLLEELELDYQIKHYKRDANTNLAPSTLKLIHPLGKSPVITDGDVTVAESGAIIEYLVEHYGEHLKPKAHTEALRQYQYWLHFAEGTLMPPMVAKLVFDKVRANAKPFFIKIIANKIADKVMDGYYMPMISGNLEYVDTHLQNNLWFAGDELSGADFQMSFPLEASFSRGGGKQYPAIAAYVQKIHQREAYKRALQKGGEYAYA
ncbi:MULTISPECIES: glutathione S-transferase [Alteromonadaceae]|uniref:glutathione S-transferase n=1 Tax=Alteromonadaceae TaxID=72275 RepID=UPI001C096552|nr:MULTISPECIES: glutathione S-transferase [Aliiglaciecola]MBU2880264.1 glutathione S-transferase [Aliiglaciecola lipolytica]MDO6712688.1 glutathione S-transferase [Aliiglaciecola sp. 2_MG-2023]MDO6752927.1 glutathione S-transferase [Aliiglaciecola sp. 1_MG-2023]